ncbi:MAG: hypothetical protein AB2L14_14820 [Candidatus Xenobiia bacterium LiM19]
MSIIKRIQKFTAKSQQNFLKDWEKLNRKPVTVKLSVSARRRALSRSGEEQPNDREDLKDTDN